MSHQTAIANGTPNMSVTVRRKFRAVSAENPGGVGMAMVPSRAKNEPNAAKPAKIRIDVRAHGWSRKSPTDVTMPTTANAAIMSPPAIAS